MYSITKRIDGKYVAACRIQDGTERWVKDTIDEAIRFLKDSAKTLNHTKIKRRDIEFFKEILNSNPPPTFIIKVDKPKKGQDI